MKCSALLAKKLSLFTQNLLLNKSIMAHIVKSTAIILEEIICSWIGYSLNGNTAINLSYHCDKLDVMRQ